jgi:hypothetical protein
MLIAIGIWAARRKKAVPISHFLFPISAVDILIAELATLDARFESAPASSAERAAYEQQRNILKDRIARALAGENAAV